MPTSLYDALDARGLRPTWAEDSINADVGQRRRGRPASRSQPAPPCCVTRRRALAGEKVVEVSRAVYRADRYTLWVQLGEES